MKANMTVSIDVECKAFLHKHTELKASQILNEAIKKLMKKNSAKGRTLVRLC